MRLWHIDLIPYLPKSQLLAQWRELNSIYAKQDKHILINYIYNYPKEFLKTYSDGVIIEMKRRHIKIREMAKYNIFFKDVKTVGSATYPEHNREYLKICYYNLMEKYMRGQRDYSKEEWDNLHKYYSKIKDEFYLEVKNNDN